eukprot:1124338-Pelagomonas_calceolata.AAC.16
MQQSHWQPWQSARDAGCHKYVMANTKKHNPPVIRNSTLGRDEACSGWEACWSYMHAASNSIPKSCDATGKSGGSPGKAWER